MVPHWKTLVEELKRKGHQSEYLDRLQHRASVLAGSASLEREMLQEMALALGRAEDKVNYSLLRLELMGKELDELVGESTRRRDLLEAFNAERERCLTARRDLAIHRESLGFPTPPNWERFYPVPPKREGPLR